MAALDLQRVPSIRALILANHVVERNQPYRGHTRWREGRVRPADLGGKGPRNTEADFSGLVARVMPNAGRRADQGRNVPEGTAAEDTKVFFAVFRPGASIGRCGVIVDVIAVFDPLPCVSMHVVEAEGVWLERADRRSLLLVPLTTAAVAICAVRADLVTPGIYSPAIRPRRILPFRLG